jgi:hypothetical protein
MTIIDLMVGHLDIPKYIDKPYEVTKDDPSTYVLSGNDVSDLLVLKKGVRLRFSIFCLLYGPEQLIIILEHVS